MVREVRKYLWDIEQSGARIQKFTDGRTLQEYEQNELLRAAVERMFGIIGEALSQIAIHHPQALSELSAAKQYIGLRNVLAHRYIDTDDEVIWA